MKFMRSSLALGILLASSATAGAGETQPGWNWNAPPRVEAPAPRPRAEKPAPCGPEDGTQGAGCAARPDGADDSLEDTLVPPAAMTSSGNRRAKKAGN